MYHINSKKAVLIILSFLSVQLLCAQNKLLLAHKGDKQITYAEYEKGIEYYHAALEKD